MYFKDMPVIDTKLIPDVPLGKLFESFSDDQPRWIDPRDPAIADIHNRPIADAYVNLLKLARAVDQLAPSIRDTIRLDYLESKLSPSDVGLDGESLRESIDNALDKIRNPWGRDLDV